MSSAPTSQGTPSRPSLSATGSSTTTPKSKSPVRSSNPSSTPPGNGVARTRSIRTTASSAATAKASARKPNSKDSKSTEDEDAKAETAQLIEDLKDQLRKTEAASEDYQKQLVVLQSRLDEALTEQTKLEETSFRHAETVTSLQNRMLEVQKSKGDMQVRLEDEQNSNNKEREAAANREAELNEVISRLKDTISTRENRRSIGGEGSLSRAASLRGRASPSTEKPPPLERRDSSQNSAQLLLQKDKIIESLRLELAEASLKVMEVDRAGGGRLQALEKQLLEVRMANAKLMEDNESYQYLLQEKTITGEFANKFAMTPSDATRLSRAPSQDAGGNLADELETVGEEGESPIITSRTKALERDLAAQKEENRAMTLYINKIITKLITTDSLEHLLESGSATGDNPLSAARAKREKELPLPPTEDEAAGAGASLLQRAGSLFGGGKRPRPKSYQPPTPQLTQGFSSNEASTAMGAGPRMSFDTLNAEIPPYLNAKPLPLPSTDDPTLSTRVPLTRGTSVRLTGPIRSHRRTTSELTPSTSGFASSTVPSLNSRAVSGSGPGQLNPAFQFNSRSSGPMSPRLSQSITSPDISTAETGDLVIDYNASNRASLPPTSAGVGAGLGIDPSSSTFAGSTDSTPTTSISTTTGTATVPSSVTSTSTPSSPPRSVGTSESGHVGRSSGGPATMTSGKQMRPLRLVQEKAEQDAAANAAAKKANRGSWMGWLSKGPGAGGAVGGALGGGGGGGGGGGMGGG